jgi:hypothetical protein
MICIGVDPAFRANGIGCCILQGNDIRFIKLGSFIAFVEFVDSLDSDADIIMVIENSNLTNATFIKTGSIAADKKISRNVGMNQAISQMFVDYAKHKLKNVHDITPKAKGAKWTHSHVIANFKNYTFSNYKGNVTEQDKRDALKLAFLGKNFFGKIVK